MKAALRPGDVADSWTGAATGAHDRPTAAQIAQEPRAPVPLGLTMAHDPAPPLRPATAAEEGRWTLAQVRDQLRAAAPARGDVADLAAVLPDARRRAIVVERIRLGQWPEFRLGTDGFVRRIVPAPKVTRPPAELDKPKPSAPLAPAEAPAPESARAARGHRQVKWREKCQRLAPNPGDRVVLCEAFDRDPFSRSGAAKLVEVGEWPEFKVELEPGKRGLRKVLVRRAAGGAA